MTILAATAKRLDMLNCHFVHQVRLAEKGPGGLVTPPSSPATLQVSSATTRLTGTKLKRVLQEEFM